MLCYFVTAVTGNIQYEQLYTHKFGNLNEMDQFLNKRWLTQLTWYERGHLNNPITIKKIEFIMKTPNSSPFPDLDGFTGEFYQTFKELNFTQSLPENRRGGILTNSFYEVNITLILR